MTEPLTEDELAFLSQTLDLAREGRTGELTERLDAGVPVNLTGGSGDSLLILAAYHVHPDTVDALLARGADHTRVNDRGQTALGAAVYRRSEPIVRALLAAGADPDLGGQSARSVAAFFGLEDMQALLAPAPPA
jgi:ankyrin repeat protein